MVQVGGGGNLDQGGNNGIRRRVKLRNIQVKSLGLVVIGCVEVDVLWVGYSLVLDLY